jgi:hypothetical protein
MTEYKNVSERENPGTGNLSECPDLGLIVDTQIMRMLGLRFEIVDDIIKVWPNDVTPDETNWLVGERFSRNLDESLNVLAGLKVEAEFFQVDRWHWATVKFGNGDEIETQEATTKEMAGAFAVWVALYCHQRRSVIRDLTNCRRNATLAQNK